MGASKEMYISECELRNDMWYNPQDYTRKVTKHTTAKKQEIKSKMKNLKKSYEDELKMRLDYWDLMEILIKEKEVMNII